jgi:RimJ/RimL family protein N-acetyltransferase
LKDDIVLTDGTVSLRPYRKSDADDLYQAVRESLPELSVWMPWAHKDYTIKESRQWLKTHPGSRRQGVEYNFAIFDSQDGSYLGGCGLNRIDDENRRANLGYWVRKSRTGQGVATAATLLLARWGFKELKLNRIEILVATGNQSSLRVAEKVGARREGILRKRIVVRDKVYDAVMFSLVTGDI